jgi:hypothetical protein
LPATQLEPLQQPPLQARLGAHDEPHLPPPHASRAAQSVGFTQPHAPPLATAMQAMLSFAIAQSVQAPPDEPHAVAPVPATQPPPEQQPPLHALCIAPPQFGVQLCVPRSQARPDGQSVAALQPHAPATQAWPALALVQSTHALPVEPHALAPVPLGGTQLMPSQQPPLQTRPAHAVEQVRVDTLHAWPIGQSAALVQPHAPETQAWPALALVQSTHALALPHAPGLVPPAQVPLSQQLPEHGWVGLQLVVQRLVLVSHALPEQSLEPLQPHAPPPVTPRHAWPSELAAQLWQLEPFAPQASGSVPI